MHRSRRTVLSRGCRGSRVHAVERHEREVHRVQHHLDAHEENEEVATEEKAHGADSEEHAGDREKVLERDGVHVRASSVRELCAVIGVPCAESAGTPETSSLVDDGKSPVPPLAGTGARPTSSCPRPRATATAPTTAIRSRTPAISN